VCSSLKCAFCYLKNQYLLEAKPHSNPVKDLKIHISNTFVVEPSGVQVLKNPNPFKDVEASVVLDVAVLV